MAEALEAAVPNVVSGDGAPYDGAPYDGAPYDGAAVGGSVRPLVDNLVHESWTAFAACRELGHLFFEPFGERPGARGRRELIAREVCAECPVRGACRDAGRRNNESGIWGGETEEERARAGFAPRSISRRSVAQARLDGESS